jgi:hypothetical protein
MATIIPLPPSRQGGPAVADLEDADLPAVWVVEGEDGAVEYLDVDAPKLKLVFAPKPSPSAKS